MGDENVKGTEGGVEAFSGALGENKRTLKLDSIQPLHCCRVQESTLRRTLSAGGVSLAGVAGVTLDEAVLRGGRGEVKSNVGKVLLGSEIRGRSGTSATCRRKSTDAGHGRRFQTDGSAKSSELRSSGAKTKTTTVTSSSSSRLDETRVVDFSLLILPPPELTLLAAGVLDRG